MSLRSARAGLSDLGIAADGDAPPAQPHWNEAGSTYAARRVARNHRECGGRDLCGETLAGGGTAASSKLCFRWRGAARLARNTPSACGALNG